MTCRLPFALLLILASGCGSRRAPSIRIDPALATLVPSGTVLLAGARLDALRATPLYRKFAADALGPVLAGVDLKDVWELLAVSNGRETAVLARGRFSSTGPRAGGFGPRRRTAQLQGVYADRNRRGGRSFCEPDYGDCRAHQRDTGRNRRTWKFDRAAGAAG